MLNILGKIIAFIFIMIWAAYITLFINIIIRLADEVVEDDIIFRRRREHPNFR